MPRVLHTKGVMPGKYPVTPLSGNSADIAWLAATPADKEEVVLTGREMLLAWNTNGAAQAHTVTITSVVDDLNRLGDITGYSVGAGEIAIFGPFPRTGWAQAVSSKLFFEADNAEILFAVITIPVVV